MSDNEYSEKIFTFDSQGVKLEITRKTKPCAYSDSLYSSYHITNIEPLSPTDTCLLLNLSDVLKFAAETLPNI